MVAPLTESPADTDPFIRDKDMKHLDIIKDIYRNFGQNTGKRWMQTGLKRHSDGARVKLRGQRIGHYWCTKRSWVEAFFAELSKTDPDARDAAPAPHHGRESEDADLLLKQDGI